ncbi:MAG: glutamate--tRNA ligase [Desulfobacteraceae bacterium]|nr:glutamate--tRNA ligase [Desulfobacteraceae bacterium]
MSEVRVRFPPSPTGYLHIGGARTAIYNWLFARKHGGKLVLRIEDTDAERSTQESIQGIIDGLTWLGIDWDEGPYFQTAHAAEHVAAANRLLAESKAYKCFCTKEELEAKREAALAAKADYKYDRTCRCLTPEESAAKEAAGMPFVIRFKVPDRPGTVAFDDKVYGVVERAYADIEDFVIVRSNGAPLYLLSNVVDDIRDRITHIIRGQDGLTNTPRQILLYEALGAQLATYAHMPLTLDLNRAKISKRSHGEIVAVQFYRDHGFLPWALANFLVLLGWSSGDDREIFSREELIAAFSLEGINRANSVFNYRPGDPKFFTDPKALNINAHYLRTMPVEEIGGLVAEELKKEGLWDPAYDGERRGWYLATVDLIRSRFHTLKDFATLGRAYFADEFEVEPQAVEKNLRKNAELKTWLSQLADRFAALPAFTGEETERVAREMAAELNVKPGLLINAARTVVTGRVAGPSMFEVLAAMGRDRVVARLRDVEKFY